jgi:ATP synthase protein I
MKNNDRLPSLDKLQAKIDKIKKPDSSDSTASSYADMSEAIRLVVDLAAGVLVGLGFGYLIDYWLISAPWGVIIGLFLGVAVGVKNMMRNAKLIDKKLNEQQKDDKKI